MSNAPRHPADPTERPTTTKPADAWPSPIPDALEGDDDPVPRVVPAKHPQDGVVWVSPERVFGRVVEENPEVCRRCFQRVRDIHTIDHDRLSTSSNAPTETRNRAGTGELGYSITSTDTYGQPIVFSPRTFCNDCGREARSLDENEWTRSHAALVDAARNVGAVLERAGVRHHPKALTYLVGKAKSRPSLSGRDSDILRTGVAFSIAQYYKQKRGCHDSDMRTANSDGT